MGYSYNNFNNQQGNYQQRNYRGNNNYSQQQQSQPAQPPMSPEEFIDNRINVYQVFVNQIKSQGLDPADFCFALGGWVSSYLISKEQRERNART